MGNPEEGGGKFCCCISGYPAGRGVKKKIPSVVEVWIFFETIH